MSEGMSTGGVLDRDEVWQKNPYDASEDVWQSLIIISLQDAFFNNNDLLKHDLIIQKLPLVAIHLIARL